MIQKVLSYGVVTYAKSGTIRCHTSILIVPSKHDCMIMIMMPVYVYVRGECRVMRRMTHLSIMIMMPFYVRGECRVMRRLTPLSRHTEEQAGGREGYKYIPVPEPRFYDTYVD